jgi:ADP-ribosylation factor-like protein 8
MKSYI